MLVLRNIWFVLGDWTFEAPREDRNDSPPDVPTELDAGICYDVGFVDINPALIRKRPPAAKLWSSSMETKFHRGF